MAVSWFRSEPPGQNKSSIVKVCLNAEPEVLVEDPAVVDDVLAETELLTEAELLEDTEPLELELALADVLGEEEVTIELVVEDAALLVDWVVVVLVLWEDARYTPATATMTMITIIATMATVLAIAPDFLISALLDIKESILNGH